MLKNITAALLLLVSISVKAQPLIKEHFGITSYLSWVPLDKSDKIKTVRSYTSAANFCQAPEEYMFEPTWRNDRYDSYLADGKNRGMKFVMCLSNNFYFFANGWTENENHPVPPGANKEDPASYTLYGKLAFQIAARYGSKTVHDSLLKVKEFPVGHWQRQTKKSGTNLLYGIEIWNEADQWGGNFTPREYFAMFSACYDGHKGTLGKDVGVMQADPDMNFFFTGTSNSTPSYAQSVKTIWEQERGEPFPENIIFNFHGYFHNKSINNNNRTTGVPPETLDALALYRQWSNFSGKNRFAKTEYGYDTNPLSIQHAPLLLKTDTGNYNIMESQAALVLRDYHLQSTFPNLFLSIFYNIRDGSGGGSTVQYSTCGVTYGTVNNYQPKESYFILGGFIEMAGNFFSDGSLVSEEPYVVRYRSKSNKYLYAVWTHIPRSTLIQNIKSDEDTIQLITLSKNGNILSSIIPQNNVFNITAGQMPSYFISETREAFEVSLCIDSPVNMLLCAGDSVLVNGTYRDAPGIYFDTIAGSVCDSVKITEIVLDESCCVSHGIRINTGWNLISSYVLPDEPNMKSVFQDIASNIVLVKNNAGKTYIPFFDINTIGNWNFTEGYQVKASKNVTLTIGCTLADPASPITLNTGWNTISFLHSQPMNAAVAFSSLGNDLLVVKNNAGATYFPSLGINLIGDLQPGQGYQLKMLKPRVFSYPGF